MSRSDPRRIIYYKTRVFAFRKSFPNRQLYVMGRILCACGRARAHIIIIMGRCVSRRRPFVDLTIRSGREGLGERTRYIMMSFKRINIFYTNR